MNAMRFLMSVDTAVKICMGPTDVNVNQGFSWNLICEPVLTLMNVVRVEGIRT